MKQEWESYWDKYRFPDHFMQSEIEPYGNPVRVLIAEHSKIGDSTLDVGSASCISFPLFKKQMYVGVDFTWNLLKTAKKNFKSVNVVHGYAQQLPFKNGSFDTVFLKDVLEHVHPEAYKTIIPEMWRIAKKQVILAFFGNLKDQAQIELSREPDEHNIGVPPYKGGIYYFNAYRRDDILTVIRSLSSLKNFEVLEHVQREISDDKGRTVVVARKK